MYILKLSKNRTSIYALEEANEEMILDVINNKVNNPLLQIHKTEKEIEINAKYSNALTITGSFTIYKIRGTFSHITRKKKIISTYKDEFEFIIQK